MIPFAADVPIIGELPEIAQHYHTFVMRCPCPAKTVTVIVGGGPGQACPGCGKTPIVGMRGIPEIGVDWAPKASRFN